MGERHDDGNGQGKRSDGIGGFLGGLGNLIEKLGDLAEKGEELKKSGQIGEPGDKLRGVYGFNVKMGIGGDKDEVKVEPFGNVHRDNETGETVVDEISEPLVDLFDEDTHVLVVAEMPGIGEEDVQLSLQDDILTIEGERGQKKYRKEVLLPQSFRPGEMMSTCRNGVLEVRLTKDEGTSEE
ncbi:MAG: Hsp20/alpha crystallin family protein [Planctomycetota bacterium]